jgi:DnaJ like chaperone protein
MSIWGKLVGAGAGLALGGPLGALLGAVAGHAFIDRPIARRAAPADRQVAFTIAAIALAAKMARADGTATDAEFQTFRRLFHVAPEEAANVARFYDLAKRSTAGAEAYARQITEILGPGASVLEDLLDILIMIARADGPVTELEIEYLERVAACFGFDAAALARFKIRHSVAHTDGPYQVLGLSPDAPFDVVRATYRQLAKNHHPDRLLAQGVPAEFIRVAETRMAEINAAYRAIVATEQAAA